MSGRFAHGALTDRSGTVATGGVAQQVCAANANRRYFFFQNNSAGDLWINFGATAVANQPSIKLATGQSFEPAGWVSTQLVSVYGATTSQAFTCKESP
jgi:hypothetical protein